MCLAKIIKQVKRPDPRVRVGYKVFINCGSRDLCFPFYYPVGNHLKAQRGRWIKADTMEQIWAHCTGSYTAGFHVFPSKSDAEAFRGECGSASPTTVVKVLFKGARTLGTQHTGWAEGEDRLLVCRCFVADKIFIPEHGKKIVRKTLTPTPKS